MPPGFLGTRADLLMDLVVVSLAAIVPTIGASWWLALRKRYPTHRTVQTTLFTVLLVVVSLFEADMRNQGGIFEMTAGSRFAGTTFLNGSIGFHTLLSISTSLLWLVLVPLSFYKFGLAAQPGPFSATHRVVGRIGMVLMLLTGITGVELYVIGFAM